jgi:hypothetical protein
MRKVLPGHVVQASCHLEGLQDPCHESVKGFCAAQQPSARMGPNHLPMREQFPGTLFRNIQALQAQCECREPVESAWFATVKGY